MSPKTTSASKKEQNKGDRYMWIKHSALETAGSHKLLLNILWASLQISHIQK